MRVVNNYIDRPENINHVTLRTTVAIWHIKVHSLHMSTDSAHSWVPSDNFGTRLLLTRRELGLNMKEAAARCGIHYSTWSTWENGRKPANMASVVRAIAGGLGVSREWLMWGQAPTDPGPGPANTNKYSSTARVLQGAFAAPRFVLEPAA